MGEKCGYMLEECGFYGRSDVRVGFYGGRAWLYDAIILMAIALAC
jgi:hypothetical protein